MPSLSSRLLKIASFIKKGERIADIGTDHGYLPIYLRQEDICPSVLACDIKMSPLSVAMKNVTLSKTDGVAFRLCDGLEGIEKDEIDAAVIAGMGGELICDILSRCNWAKDSGKHFILQPMNSPETVREFLYKNGYTLNSESAVRDAGRVYTVLDVIAKEDTRKLDDGFFFTGLLDPQNECDREMLEKQYTRLKNCADSLESNERSHEYAYYRDAAAYIRKRLEK